ncbi:gamma-glutamyl-gamma-aminobutyrate hydrolase family protein [Actinomadura sp. DC4]|uniref:gamma-glutamyl-gamma-aminobutyrate hydrolase family protein n=1 Tax=Actinomadura sp. DC4 TaxID=3055069 RepID=UPI0025AF0AD6|nr:gamma-glutamyl-gamma-aminobutyrate hydrolase family protein [Actinomadura sp. DC4]MDN3351652.1 gamma-glutamyl-gamma-aminobutyrate hydrolase family protein [Actinomadura sp. DC4]
MTAAPLIGITSYVELARFTVWEMPATLLPHAYVEQVVRAGGQPVVLPPAGDPSSVLSRLDGLILVGGGDVSPASYGAVPHPRTGYVRDFRDTAELALVRAALDRGLPFLGICRGAQVLNVALGGTLHQHVPDVVGDERHSLTPGSYNRFPVTVAVSSRLFAAVGAPAVTVAHYHHQAIDRLGAGMTACAWADDGLIEAAEVEDHPFALGVQWHPEVDEDLSLFRALVRH